MIQKRSLKYKFIALFLVLAMTIGIMPNFVFADGDLMQKEDNVSEMDFYGLKPFEPEWYDENTFVLDTPNVEGNEYVLWRHGTVRQKIGRHISRARPIYV